MKKTDLSIDQPRLESTSEGRTRITAQVGRREVWFESEAPLAPAVEAFLGAFLLPVMSRGVGLRTDAPVCPVWLRNVEGAKKLAREWWGFTGGDIHTAGEKPLERATGVAVLFGGGVDSFYTLLSEQERVTHLLYIEGYDVALEDRARLESVRRWNKAVAEACGKQLIRISTNLRKHPEFRMISWEQSCGSALAATGHLIRDLCSDILLASSYSEKDWQTWGSHRYLDPCWSSGATNVVHHGAELERREKVLAIADSPIVHKYLRVCWEHRDQALNCGVCEKCIRTQLEFYMAGTLDKVETFPRGSLLERINQLPSVSIPTMHFYQGYLEYIDDEEIADSIRSLLARTPAPTGGQEWRQGLVALVRTIRRWLG